MKMNDKTAMKQKHHAKNVVSIVIQRSILGINNSVYSVVYYSHDLGVYVCVRVRACACVCVRVRTCAYVCVRVHSFDE